MMRASKQKVCADVKHSFLMLMVCSLVCAGSALADDGRGLPVISIIVDDLGYQLNDGRRVVDLPGPVACSVLPHTPYGERLARAAHVAGKEVLLHLPMQAMNNKDPGFGALTLETGEQD